MSRFSTKYPIIIIIKQGEKYAQQFTKKKESALNIVECAYFVQPTIIRLKKINLYIQETTGRKVISQQTNQKAKGNTEGAEDIDYRTDVSTGQAYSEL